MSITRTTIGVVLAGATVIGLAGPAFAASASPSTTDPGQKLAAVKAAGAAAISQRETQLNKLASELAKAPSCDANGAIAGEIASDGPALTALGSQLAADTTVDQAKTDFQSIFTTYRIYLVVTPQAYVTAACGHIQTANTKLAADEQKLAAKVAALPDGATKTAAMASLQDMTTQLAGATTQGSAAYTTLATIAPDKGDKTAEAANAAAVKSAHGQLVTARDDLKAAVADAKAVVADLKA